MLDVASQLRSAWEAVPTGKWRDGGIDKFNAQDDWVRIIETAESYTDDDGSLVNLLLEIPTGYMEYDRACAAEQAKALAHFILVAHESIPLLLAELEQC